MPNDAAARFLHIPTWKKTTLGTPIELHASASLDTLKRARPILLMGGIHGDEPEGVRLANETLKWLKSTTAAEKTLCPWIIIPCLNVDGFKNETRTNARGVDLNRNYPSKDWSSEARAARYFPGAHAGSETEVQAVVELILAFQPRLIIHCHSWNPCIVGAGASAQADVDRLSRSSGFEGRTEIGYPTPGALSSFGFHDHGIPVICIEEDDQNENLELIWPRFETGMREVFEDLSDRKERAR